MRHPEAALQRQIVGYLSWALAPPAWFTTIGHGGGGLMRGMILKGMGMKAGVPDLMILYDKNAYFVELKAAKGVLSDAQKATHAALWAAKCPVAVVRSLDEFRALLGGPWWPLMSCIRETKPAIERIRQGISSYDSRVAPTLSGSWNFPESDNLGRKRRAKT